MARQKIYTTEERIHRSNYLNHQSRAFRRGIAWEFTFETWMKVWQDSGHYAERGRCRGEYVMARKGPDIGPYAPYNVDIQLSGQNNSDAHLGKKPKSTPLTDEQKKHKSEAISAKRKGKAPWNKGLKEKKMSLPDMRTSIESLKARPETMETLNNLLERKQDLEDYVAVIQPLLYTLSVKLCGEKTEMPLKDLVEMSIKFIGEAK
jgi:hypothetical protein